MRYKVQRGKLDWNYGVFLMSEDGKTRVRAIITDLPSRPIANEIAMELNTAYRDGEIAGSLAHLQAPKTIEELEARIMSGEIQADPPPFDIEELRKS